MKFPVISSFLLLTCCSHLAVAQNSKAQLIEQLISDLSSRHLFNGAIVVGEKDNILLSKGFGFANFRDSHLFTPNTPADGGSNAKTFTAACILLLAEEGKLKLSDPVQKYLPGYPYPNTTVRNLITHSTGGLPDYDYFFEKAGDTAILTNVLNLTILNTYKPRLAYSPNTNFYYDNVGFDLAALVIERVTRISYSQFLYQRIFQPLQMDSTFVRPSKIADWNPGRTIGYHYQGDSLQLLDIADREGFYGGGNIWFTATDLYRWGHSFCHSSLLGKPVSNDVVSPVSIDSKPSYVRLGAWYPGKTKNAFYYWGNVAGFYSWIYWDKENQFTIAFMTNTDMPQWARPLLTSALINIMSGKDYLPVTEPETGLIDMKDLRQVTGHYKLEKSGKVQVFLKGPKVCIKLPNGMEYQMHKVDNKTFYIPGLDPWISFQSMKKGRYQTIYWSSTTLQTSGKRVSD